MQKLIELEVRDAFPDDVGHGRVCIDRKVCEQYALSIGDAIELMGAKNTVASIGKSHSLDDGKNVIRIDALTRKEVGVEIDDLVKIRRAKVEKAKQIVLMLGYGYEGGKVGKGSLPLIKKELINRFLAEGKTVAVSGIGLYRDVLPFVVDKTEPKGYVCVDKSTIVRVKGEF